MMKFPASHLKGTDSLCSGVAPHKDDQGLIHTDSNNKANILNKQFSSVFNKNEDLDSIPDKGPSPHPSIDDITMKQEGIRKLLANLNPHKATGSDNIPTRLLKNLANQLAPVFTILFQASLNQNTVPTD